MSFQVLSLLETCGRWDSPSQEESPNSSYYQPKNRSIIDWKDFYDRYCSSTFHLNFNCHSQAKCLWFSELWKLQKADFHHSEHQKRKNEIRPFYILAYPQPTTVDREPKKEKTNLVFSKSWFFITTFNNSSNASSKIVTKMTYLLLLSNVSKTTWSFNLSL